MKRPSGIIIYRGPSQIDGAPIVAILTGIDGKARNRKTGLVLQTWIMRDDVAPHVALKTGQDASVCGDCIHRPANGGACYVRVFQAPLVVWKAAQRGVYAQAADLNEIASVAAGRIVRLGSYGDPAAVPVAIWRALVSGAAAHTGYTHQWRNAPGLADLCMASADSPEEAALAQAQGWRTFRVRAPYEPVMAREFVCPASKEAGAKTDCAACRACGGTASKAKASPVIIAHGATARRFILTRSQPAIAD
tara:strand:- start:314 stop:1060 length:747 start_codon:yes stop_codon:yes gene_type:complete